MISSVTLLRQGYKNITPRPDKKSRCSVRKTTLRYRIDAKGQVRRASLPKLMHQNTFAPHTVFILQLPDQSARPSI